MSTYQGGESTLSGYCSQRGYDRPRVAFGEDETLLIRRDALLVLDLCLDVVDRVGRFNLEGDCLSGESFDKDLHGEDEWVVVVGSKRRWGCGRRLRDYIGDDLV